MFESVRRFRSVVTKNPRIANSIPRANKCHTTGSGDDDANLGKARRTAIVSEQTRKAATHKRRATANTFHI